MLEALVVVCTPVVDFEAFTLVTVDNDDDVDAEYIIRSSRFSEKRRKWETETAKASSNEISSKHMRVAAVIFAYVRLLLDDASDNEDEDEVLLVQTDPKRALDIVDQGVEESFVVLTSLLLQLLLLLPIPLVELFNPRVMSLPERAAQ